MQSSLPRTALAGRSRSPQDQLAKGLGYFSIGLGIAELLAPQTFCRTLGLRGHETLVRSFGAREIATGVAILASHDPTPWIWGRVLGDAADIGTVAQALDDENPKKENAALALAALIGVTALDLVCAASMTTEKGGRKTALTNYSSRSGFPQGLQSARGAASDFEVPADMRIPEPLRPDTFRARPATH
jgi:hypothetical protein